MTKSSVGKRASRAALRAKLAATPSCDADCGEDAGFAEDDADDVGAGCAHGFEDADLAGALHDGGVHGLKDDEKADDDGDADDDAKADVEAGEAVG